MKVYIKHDCPIETYLTPYVYCALFCIMLNQSLLNWIVLNLVCDVQNFELILINITNPKLQGNVEAQILTRTYNSTGLKRSKRWAVELNTSIPSVLLLYEKYDIKSHSKQKWICNRWAGNTVRTHRYTYYLFVSLVPNRIVEYPPK